MGLNLVASFARQALEAKILTLPYEGVHTNKQTNKQTKPHNQDHISGSERGAVLDLKIIVG